jgi:hypothetical protein
VIESRSRNRKVSCGSFSLSTFIPEVRLPPPPRKLGNSTYGGKDSVCLHEMHGDEIVDYKNG